MLRRNSSGGLRGSGARLSHTEPGADVTVPPELQVADDDAGLHVQLDRLRLRRHYSFLACARRLVGVL